jgi:hypothetical protein
MGVANVEFRRAVIHERREFETKLVKRLVHLNITFIFHHY